MRQEKNEKTKRNRTEMKKKQWQTKPKGMKKTNEQWKTSKNQTKRWKNKNMNNISWQVVLFFNKEENKMQTETCGKKTNTFLFALQQFLQLVIARGYGQRRQKEKGNTCVGNEKTRREKQRQQMNKSMSKRTYRGNARIQKGISWIFCDTKEGEIVFEKNW